jgi:hypothetical protein
MFYRLDFNQPEETKKRLHNFIFAKHEDSFNRDDKKETASQAPATLT